MILVNILNYIKRLVEGENSHPNITNLTINFIIELKINLIDIIIL